MTPEAYLEETERTERSQLEYAQFDSVISQFHLANTFHWDEAQQGANSSIFNRNMMSALVASSMKQERMLDPAHKVEDKEDPATRGKSLADIREMFGIPDRISDAVIKEQIGRA